MENRYVTVSRCALLPYLCLTVSSSLKTLRAVDRATFRHLSLFSHSSGSCRQDSYLFSYYSTVYLFIRFAHCKCKSVTLVTYAMPMPVVPENRTTSYFKPMVVFCDPDRSILHRLPFCYLCWCFTIPERLFR